MSADWGSAVAAGELWKLEAGENILAARWVSDILISLLRMCRLTVRDY